MAGILPAMPLFLSLAALTAARGIMYSMDRQISILSIATAALLITVLPFAPVGDASNVTGRGGQSLVISTSLILPFTGVLAPTQVPRPTWLPGGAKQRPTYAVTGQLIVADVLRGPRERAEVASTPRSELGKFRIIAGRSPPALTLLD